MEPPLLQFLEAVIIFEESSNNNKANLAVKGKLFTLELLAAEQLTLQPMLLWKSPRYAGSHLKAKSSPQ